jgi:ABC-type uncharacterized transport system
MSDQPTQPETQQQRWMKYGVNVAITVIVVAVLAVVVIYIASVKTKRIDTTANADFSLKPQTLNIIKSLDSPIKIVSLYSKPQSDRPQDITAREQADAVADLLQEYKQDGKDIDVEVIDPTVNQAKVDDLYNEVTSKYGGEVKKYKTFLDKFPSELADLKTKATAEVTAAANISTKDLGNDDNSQVELSVLETIDQMPKDLDSTKQSIDRRLAAKHPDYKPATDAAQAAMSTMSQRAQALSDIAAKIKEQGKFPADFVTYLSTAAPRFDAMKKQADDISKEIDALGSLKVDDLTQSLKDPNPIVVMGKDDMRVLPYEQVWRTPQQPQMMLDTDVGKIKPTFAGEQEISTAIYGLTAGKKPKVCIIRNGGAPLATPGFPPFQPGGPMSQVADRLRQYNFQVLEKDITGTYAMQAQMQGGQPEPEPSDDDIKDAVWVVLATPSPQQSPMGGPPPSMAPKVLDHINQGGSALILLAPQGEDFEPGLKDWGIDAHTNMVAVHALVKTSQAQGGDILEEALKYPFIFDLSKYGDAALAKPLASLKSFLVPLMPMRVVDAKDCKVTPMIPIPQDPPSWGDANLEGLQTDMDVKFSPDKGDLENTPSNPLYGGAAAERKSGNRLVVIGSPEFMFDGRLNIPDPQLIKRGIFISRFPANAELFCNSVYWLAHMDSMIAISPASMQVSRISEMSDGALRAWRVGLLLIGLPGAVILWGLLVYVARRD